MEKWEEIFIGEIPKGIYQTKMINGEEDGLIVELENATQHVTITFGAAEAVRMLNEGIVQENLYSEQETAKFKNDNFKNIIYKITNGEFEKQIKANAGEFQNILEINHYVIISQNYNIDVITEGEPTLKVVYKTF